MQRACNLCGTTYEAKRSTSKFCGSGCRARSSQGAGKSPPVTLPTPQSAATQGGVVESTRAVLSEAGRLDSPLGAAALVLAGRLDSNRHETGAGLASLAKQLQATLAAATADVKQDQSALDAQRDELAARRRRLGA